MLFFTICHIHQLPNASVLGDSIKLYHPDADFFIGLVDKKERIPAGFKTSYRIVEVSELQMEHFESMAGRYTSDELLADCKPFFTGYALKQSAKVVYFDCTSVLYSSADFIDKDLDNYNIIIVPQLLHAGVHPDEKQTLNTGIFHAGFLGLRQSEETKRFIDWWGNNTALKGNIDLCKGLNADQLWLEHVPNFYDNVLILKHEGLNVGVWNMPERTVDFLKHTSNGQPLVSVNFKGMKHIQDYARKLKAYTIAPTPPLYGLPNPKGNTSGKRMAKGIREFNSLVDKIIDLIQ